MLQYSITRDEWENFIPGADVDAEPGSPQGFTLVFDVLIRFGPVQARSNVS